MTAANVHQIEIVVNNLGQAMTFWRDGLKLPEVEAANFTNNPATVAYLAGSTVIRLMQWSAQAPNVPGINPNLFASFMMTVVVEVADLLGTVTNLQTLPMAGITFSSGAPGGSPIVQRPNGDSFASVNPGGTGGLNVILLERRVF